MCLCFPVGDTVMLLQSAFCKSYSNMKVSFTPELNYRADSKGEHLIQIRCSQNRTHKRINTQVSVAKKYWDKGKQEVKRSHPQADQYNRIIRGWLQKLSKSYSDLLEAGEDVTTDNLMAQVNKPKALSFYKFAEETKLAEFKAKQKMGTYRRYEAILNKLKEYAPHLTVRKVDYRFLKDYQNYLLETLGNSRDTVSSNLSAIRSIVNTAIACGVYEKQNPFGQMKLQYTDNTKAKLTIEELQRFQNCKLPDTHSLHLARDFFMACFYANGCRAGDMVAMNKTNIIAGQLMYVQGKTERKTILPISPELDNIFSKYLTTGRSCIFPLFNDGDTIDERTINSKITYINKYIKEVCKYAGIFTKISTHCARHTLIDHALTASGENIYEVKNIVNHSSVRVTEGYARQRVSKKAETITAQVFKEVNTEQ